jgi:hypothetical protein
MNPGYGYHGDFMTGWDVDFLQDAVNTCTNPSGEITDCPLFNIQTQEEGAKCKIATPEALVDDNCAGPAEGLCGNVPIQAGPEYASLLLPGNEATPTAAFTDLTTLASLVPTLSFATATLAVTDKYGGGINVGEQSELPGEVNASAVVPEPTPSVPEPTPLVPEATLPALPQEPVATGASVASVVVPGPLPTSAPVAPPVEGSAGSGNILSTSTFTSAGIQYEVVVEEVTVFVTVEAAAPAKRHRRHNHLHRRDHEHGLLNRY